MNEEKEARKSKKAYHKKIISIIDESDYLIDDED